MIAIWAIGRGLRIQKAILLNMAYLEAYCDWRGVRGIDILYNNQNHVACTIIDLVTHPRVNLTLHREHSNQCIQTSDMIVCPDSIKLDTFRKTPLHLPLPSPLQLTSIPPKADHTITWGLREQLVDTHITLGILFQYLCNGHFKVFLSYVLTSFS